MISKKPTYCSFKSIKNEGGENEIDVLEIEQEFSFSVKRIYFLFATHNDLVRGKHAHKNQKQILYKIKGRAKVLLLDNIGVEYSFNLENQPLYIPENYWIELFMEKGTEIMCLAEQSYTNLQTITNKSVFLDNK